MKSILVAYDEQHGIGADNDLLWLRDLPDDLDHFKHLTTGNAIIMGRKTYESIGRPLPQRQNIVISRAPMQLDGLTVVSSVAAAYAAVSAGKEAFIIGGGQIYALALASVDRIYATEVKATFQAATVFFPKIDSAIWREASREHRYADAHNKYDFDFVVYDRV